ncbi:hypothetical protein [Treponema sp. Marseille-Q4130]|uniref:hypothetical protein n=1 Tax=Treponema sp. Marseille-Q4130 TaxID=2766702 RepID=UPI0016521382|nr:hypothetical protein [Treponema sp. Marseille-Q4130]MBC6719141.1 hypothetical protein [Treponema sp. Marseille-Q4130]
MKKAIFAAAAIFFGLVFLSCSDVFGGRETEGIAFTVPPLAPQSASSPARAAAGGAEGPWSIYGFLFGEDADPAEINNIVTKRSDPLSLHEVQDYRGIIQAVSRKGADLSQPQPLFFQRIPAKTKCFVCILVTYTTSAKTEHTVFYGISPDSVLNQYGAKPSFTDNFYTPDTGENEISVTLKRDGTVPVCFATQNGASLPQESTPYKPTHFYGSHGGNMTGALGAVKGLPPGKAGVIILMENIDVSGISALPSISTSGNGVDHSVDFDSISGKRCELKAKDFSVSEGRYLSFTDVRIEGTEPNPHFLASVQVNQGGELRLGGAVTLEGETKIQLDAYSFLPGQNGKIVIVRPLVDEVGKVIVEYRDSSPTEAEEHAKADMQTYPILRDDSGANTQIPDFFDDEVKVVYSGHHSFTARWKRKDGNSWVLEARD